MSQTLSLIAFATLPKQLLSPSSTIFFYLSWFLSMLLTTIFSAPLAYMTPEEPLWLTLPFGSWFTFHFIYSSESLSDWRCVAQLWQIFLLTSKELRPSNATLTSNKKLLFFQFSRAFTTKTSSFLSSSSRHVNIIEFFMNVRRNFDFKDFLQKDSQQVSKYDGYFVQKVF